ncbi:MAG: D-2-hydroxyacid dehydrogenase [Gammaproteobacteria bacterium]
MNGIFLDTNTINHDDMDFSGICSTLTKLDLSDYTKQGDVLAQIKDKHVVISNKVNLTADILTATTALKLVCIAATGMNNIDLPAAISNNIVVCNVENYANESVTQHVFGLIISLIRSFPAYKNALNNNDWHQSQSFSLLNYNIENLSNKTLGIIGYGTLGKAVEKMAHCFGMDVIIAEHKTLPLSKVRPGRVLFNTVLEQADIVTLHCPLTDATKNLISTSELQRMKASSILINTARGGVVNELALSLALQNKEIAAAGIDVLAQEPPSDDSILLGKECKRLNNLIVTPHIAWASRQSRQNLLNKIAENINCFRSGKYRNLSNFYFL